MRKLTLITVVFSLALFHTGFSQTEEWPRFETAKTKPKAVSVSLNGTLEEVQKAIQFALVLLDIPYKIQTPEAGFVFAVGPTRVLERGREVCEYFEYDKAAYEGAWKVFDEESLEKGRTVNLRKMYKDPSSGLGGLMSTSGMSDKTPFDRVYYEGRITFESAGSAKTKVIFEYLFFGRDPNEIPGKQAKEMKSQGLLEKELTEVTENILLARTMVFPGTPEEVRQAALGILGMDSLRTCVDVSNGFVTERVTTPKDGPESVGNLAKLPRQLMAMWIGTYRALFTFEPVDDGSKTQVKAVYYFMAINGNNGERRWEAYPSKGDLENNFFIVLREKVREGQKQKEDTESESVMPEG